MRGTPEPRRCPGGNSSSCSFAQCSADASVVGSGRRGRSPGAGGALLPPTLRPVPQTSRTVGGEAVRGSSDSWGASLSEDRTPVPSLQCLISPCSLRGFPRTGWWPLRCPGPAHHCTAQAGHPESPYPTRVLVSPSEGLFQVASPFGFKLGQ